VVLDSTKKTLVGKLCQRKGAKTSWRSLSVSPDGFSSRLRSAMHCGVTQQELVEDYVDNVPGEVDGKAAAKGLGGLLSRS